MAKLKRKQNKKFDLLIYVLLIINFILLFIILFNYSNRPLEVRDFDVSFIVGPITGFDVNNSLLTYGEITPGSTSVRRITIENNYDFPIRVKVYVSDNLEDFISADSDFVVQSKEKRSLPVALYVKEGTPFAKYSGKIVFELRK